MEIESIRQLCQMQPFQMTQHAELRRRQRGITIPNIIQAIMSGEIIEDYPDDYPFPSALLLGYTEVGAPLHIVCGVGDGTLFIITAYQPSEEKWASDWKTRKEARP